MRLSARLTRIFAALLSGGLLVCLLSSAVFMLGTSDSLMQSLMLRTAPPESTFLPEDAYPSAVHAITSYLRGTADTFQFTFWQDGTEYMGFNAREQAHMADCQALFLLCRTIAAVSGSISIVLLSLLLAARRKADFTHLATLLRWELLAVALLGAAAARCFSDAFVLFHHLLFRNDLWLLNPQTDLLIRLMPTAFFEQYALLIAAVFVLGAVLLEALALLSAHCLNHSRKKDSP